MFRHSSRKSQTVVAYCIKQFSISLRRTKCLIERPYWKNNHFSAGGRIVIIPDFHQLHHVTQIKSNKGEQKIKHKTVCFGSRLTRLFGTGSSYTKRCPEAVEQQFLMAYRKWLSRKEYESRKCPTKKHEIMWSGFVYICHWGLLINIHLVGQSIVFVFLSHVLSCVYQTKYRFPPDNLFN